MTWRVLYFTDSSAMGGAEQVLLTLMSHLDRRVWEPTLVHHPEPGIVPLVEGAWKSGVATWCIPRLRGQQGMARLPEFVSNLRARRAAVFHAHLTMPLACKLPLCGAALARVPAVIATEHLYVNIPYRHSRWVERLVAPGVDRYIAVSQSVARSLAGALPFLARKLTVIHNGIAMEGLQADTPRSADRPPVILTTARLTPQKGLHYLLNAAVQVPDARFWIVGEGPERAALQSHTERLGIASRVVFWGKREDVGQLLRQSTLFVLPSLYEGLPLAVLEAMAAGVPVIATDVGGTREAISNGETGWLVPPADSDALAGAIRNLVSNSLLRQSLVQAALGRVRSEFSAETMVWRTTRLYGQLLAARGAL